jgi:hypothetical protein
MESQGREFLLWACAAIRALAEGVPKKNGREIIMNASCKRPVSVEFHALLALVAGSAIRSQPAPQPGASFADWEKERKSADVDALILAWIASYVPGSAHRGRLH